jgi:hypothetical protein
MSYSTHAFPEWRSLNPIVHNHDYGEYVEKTNRILKDIFGENQEIDRPERDAPRYAKALAVPAALVLERDTENQTLGELCGLMPPYTQGLATERGVEDVVVTPKVLAVAAYADVVQSLEWGVEQLDEEWDAQTFVLVHDSLDDLKKVWES